MQFEGLIEEARKSEGYSHYKKILPHILNMMSEKWEGESMPSKYWQEELEGFAYMFDASPLVVERLREHCYHLTGLKSYEYRAHHAHKAKPFESKLNALKEIDASSLFVPESPILGGFGHQLGDTLLNLDTLKFYESLIAMDKGGILSPLMSSSQHQTVVEIGAGWGGFGYQLKTLCKNLTYVIVDLPQTLLFSSVYLSTAFPEANIFIYGEGDLETALKNIEQYDFVFLPHYLIPTYKIPNLHLAINMISFQEMTSEQVRTYVNWLAESSCETIYSHNRGRSPHNIELTDVTAILQEFYELSRIDILPVPYTVLGGSASTLDMNRTLPKDLASMAKHILLGAARQAKKKVSGPRLADYQHTVGCLKR